MSSSDISDSDYKEKHLVVDVENPTGDNALFEYLESNCDSEHEIFTLEKWKDLSPEVLRRVTRIRYPDGKVFCADSKNIEQGFSSVPTVANWVPKPGMKVDVAGRHGDPGGMRFEKMPDSRNTYIDEASRKLIEEGPGKCFDLDELPGGRTRIGSVSGHFHVSDVHGQLPGEKIFKARPSRDEPCFDMSDEWKEKNHFDHL
jgi:hypothetical protein